MVVLTIPFNIASAQESFDGGQASTLSVKNGAITTKNLSININIHVGFSEIEQTYVFQNDLDTAQTANLGFSYILGENDNGVANININVSGKSVDLNSSQEPYNNTTLYWKNFNVDFAPNESKEIKVYNWQLNGGDLRGTRSVNFNFKKKQLGKIGAMDLTLNLLDGISSKSFDKTVNPDLDLKIIPFGYKVEGSDLVWHWQDFEPVFDMSASFYWPKGDLANIDDLSQKIGLYDVTSAFDSSTAPALADSSYTTFWQINDLKPAVKPSAKITLPAKQTIDQIGIIPGNSNNQVDFKNNGRPKEIRLIFDNNTSEKFVLSDTLKMQYFSLSKPVSTQQIEFIIDSYYKGKPIKNKYNVCVTELEFNSTVAPVATLTESVTPISDNQPVTPKYPAWKHFFINIWQKILGFLEGLLN